MRETQTPETPAHTKAGGSWRLGCSAWGQLRSPCSFAPFSELAQDPQRASDLRVQDLSMRSAFPAAKHLREHQATLFGLWLLETGVCSDYSGWGWGRRKRSKFCRKAANHFLCNPKSCICCGSHLRAPLNRLGFVL